MVECGLRAGEVIAMTVPDLDLQAGPRSFAAARAAGAGSFRSARRPSGRIDRYLRARRTHKLASTPRLWLGGQNKGFGYDAPVPGAGARAKAGVDGFHPHRLRHTAAHRWLAAGGSEGGLQAVAGWSSRPC